MSPYQRPRTATETAIRRIKREDSMTRAIRNARVGRRQGSGGMPLIDKGIDALILAALSVAFYGIYHLFRGLFLAARWGFRRLRS